jgi:hypothetical protein
MVQASVMAVQRAEQDEKRMITLKDREKVIVEAIGVCMDEHELHLEEIYWGASQTGKSGGTFASRCMSPALTFDAKASKEMQKEPCVQANLKTQMPSPCL